MTKEEMLTEMIHMFGFEHVTVIRFARMIEKGVAEDVLLSILEYHKGVE